MATPTFDELLAAGCHFGHLKRKWNPAMAPYIFMERNGIHIIDLYKTAAKIDEAAAALKNIAKSGKRVLFVATKRILSIKCGLIFPRFNAILKSYGGSFCIRMFPIV